MNKMKRKALEAAGWSIGSASDFLGLTPEEEVKAMKESTAVEKSSGNVFADLGLPDAKDMYVKAVLAMKINDILKQRKLTQKEAAAILNVTQTRVSALNSGRKLREFSIDMLIGFLTRLDQDVEIVVKRKPRSHSAGEIRVAI
jgi:predicted XRE-type DNA-binding protein